MKNFSQSLNTHFLCFDPIYKRRPLQKISKNPRKDSPGAVKEGTFEVERGFECKEDGTVDVGFFAPDAKEVTVTYDAGAGVKSVPGDFATGPFGYDSHNCTTSVTVQMKKDEYGYWRAKLDPGPGVFEIFYKVDGVPCVNPWAPVSYGDYGVRNFVNLPDDPCYELQDVPHGSLTREIYYSKTTERMHACMVYTPPGYKSSDERYPVLYIQHGGTGDEVVWFLYGKLDMMVDNLSAAGEAKPMIIVTNCGYPFKEIEPGVFTECAFSDLLINDCIPFIDANYRTIADREHRAVAGLSMGGGHARRCGLGHTDVFANVGLFSSGEGFPIKKADFDFTELFSDSKKFNEHMKTVFVSCGDVDPRIEYTEPEVKALIEKGFNLEFKAYRGKHEWNVWRASARDFIKKIFN